MLASVARLFASACLPRALPARGVILPVQLDRPRAAFGLAAGAARSFDARGRGASVPTRAVGHDRGPRSGTLLLATRRAQHAERHVVQSAVGDDRHGLLARPIPDSERCEDSTLMQPLAPPHSFPPSKSIPSSRRAVCRVSAMSVIAAAPAEVGQRDCFARDRPTQGALRAQPVLSRSASIVRHGLLRRSARARRRLRAECSPPRAALRCRSAAVAGRPRRPPEWRRCADSSVPTFRATPRVAAGAPQSSE